MFDRRYLKRLIFLSCILTIFSGCTTDWEVIEHHPQLTQVDAYTLSGGKHWVEDYAPMDSAGNIYVVVEIPAGTNAKWEVDKATGQMRWDFRHGEPRIVAYLAYPGNYGMVPQSLLPKEAGGDGDPLDVIVLGPTVPRGTVISAHPVGVLRMLDGGEQDDKIIAVRVDSKLGDIRTLAELQNRFNGVTEILEIWFTNYKGPSEMECQGLGDEAEARQIIDVAIKAYQQAKLSIE